MPTTIRVQNKKSIPKGNLKPDFELYSDQVGAPVIVPVTENGVQFDVIQTTIVGPDGAYKSVKTEGSRVSLLEGTAFSVGVTALNPQNPSDPYNIEDLKFAWYKNESYLYDVNNQNDFKGYNVITYTAEQCTPELTGNYHVEITNSTGTTRSVDLVVTVYNRANVPELYGNLLQNGSGEAGLDNWETENGITTKEFDPTILQSSNLGSINIQDRLWKNEDISLVPGDTDFAPIQPQGAFRFSSEYNWINFTKYFNNWKQGVLQDEWWYTNVPPNLISNEDPDDKFGCFYPSRRYVDEYNDNQGKLGLLEEMTQVQSYFTKEPTQRKGNPIATMTQTIDVSNADDFIDGNVCGVDQLVGNFFAYAGIGIDSYEYVVEYKDVYKKGPGDWNIYDGVRTTISASVAQAQSYWNVPMLQVETSGQVGGITKGLQSSPIGIAKNEYANKAIHTDGVAAYHVDRSGSTNYFPNLNTPNGAFQYTPPQWQYPIMKDLFSESVAYGANTSSRLVGEKIWGSFRWLFGQLLIADSGSASYPEFAALDKLTHPQINSNNPASRQIAIAYLTGSMTERFVVVENAIMDNIIKPLNKYFNLDLTKSPQTYTGEDVAKYQAYKLLTHLIVSKPSTQYRDREVRNQTCMPVIKKLDISDTIDRYKEARQLQNELFGTIAQASTGNIYWQYYVRILEFFIYRNVLNGSIIDNFELVQPAGPNTYLKTLALDSEQLKSFFRGDVSTIKNDLTLAKRINIVPKVNNPVEFTFRYIDAFGAELKRDSLQGPTEDDLFAVKEKVLLSSIIGKLLQRTCNLPSMPIPVTYKGYTELFQLSNNIISSPSQPWINTNYPEGFFTRLGQVTNLRYDPGAAAFFAVQKKLYIPRSTRSIEVTAVLNHNSLAYGLEQDTGLDRYDLDEIPGEHTNNSFKFFKSGNPKVGLTHMKLCLYDNDFKRTVRYPHYYVPQKHIWSILKGNLYKDPYFYTKKASTVSNDYKLPTSNLENFDYNPPTRKNLS